MFNAIPLSYGVYSEITKKPTSFSLSWRKETAAQMENVHQTLAIPCLQSAVMALKRS